jgi:CRISPR-associated protein Cmr1
MNRKTIDCKLITPMLMHGEDTQVAELRPPSIKGAMRFWWRAIHGNLTLDELKKQESLLFGGANENSAVKSSFRIKIGKGLSNSKSINSLPHKRVITQGYEENQKFEIEFLSNKELTKVEKIFELTAILGGFGLRSRRGFGCVSMIKDNSTPITEEYIKGLIADINKEFKYTSTVQYPYIKEFKIGKTYRNFNDLQKVISNATSGKCGKHLFNDSRFSSPIYVSILKFNDNDYRPIITTLNCTSVKFKNKTKEEGLKVMNEFKKAIL